MINADPISVSVYLDGGPDRTPCAGCGYEGFVEDVDAFADTPREHEPVGMVTIDRAWVCYLCTWLVSPNLHAALTSYRKELRALSEVEQGVAWSVEFKAKDLMAAHRLSDPGPLSIPLSDGDYLRVAQLVATEENTVALDAAIAYIRDRTAAVAVR